MEYTALFHSHFCATRFARRCRSAHIACTLRPVPRALSSSCGTCAVFSADVLPQADLEADAESCHVRRGDGYAEVWHCAEP